MSDYERVLRRSKRKKLEGAGIQKIQTTVACARHLLRYTLFTELLPRVLLFARRREECTLTKAQKRAYRDPKIDVKALSLPAFFGEPRGSYIVKLLRIRSVFFRTHGQQLTTALRVLFNLCHMEYLKGSRPLTREAIQELVTATADLAFQLRLPKISLMETKSRLSGDIQWWNAAWVDEEASVNLADRVVPSTIASQSGRPHWLEVELRELRVTLNALNKTYSGPESRTTKKLLRNESIEETSGIKIFEALKSAGSKIDRSTFDKLIGPQIKRPKSSGP